MVAFVVCWDITSAMMSSHHLLNPLCSFSFPLMSDGNNNLLSASFCGLAHLGVAALSMSSAQSAPWKNLVPVTFVWHQAAELCQLQSRGGAGRGGKSMGLQFGKGFHSLSVAHVTNGTAKGGKAEAELKITELRYSNKRYLIFKLGF